MEFFTAAVRADKLARFRRMRRKKHCEGLRLELFSAIAADIRGVFIVNCPQNHRKQ